MNKQDLFYPEIEVLIGDYIFDHGISIKTYSDKSAPMDWGKLTFTNPYKESISLTDLADITVSLGYNGSLQKVFIGNLVKGYDGAGSLNEILFKDKMLLLEKVIITDTFINCTPQEIIRECLKKAGITEYHLSSITYPIKSIVPVISKNVIRVLKQINTSWGISIDGAFIKGVFYWGMVPDQEDILEFEYGNNIISLDRNKEMWELTTVSVPGMQHSQKINITHPKITGTFETQKIIFQTNEAGFIRTQIYFKE